MTRHDLQWSIERSQRVLNRAEERISKTQEFLNNSWVQFEKTRAYLIQRQAEIDEERRASDV